MTGKLIIKPVAWSGGVVTKYRASVEFEDSSVISGDPMPTENEAVISLGEECKAWTERVKMVKAIVKTKLNL